MTVSQLSSQPSLASRLINGILAIKPFANFAKHQARQMMIERAEKIGVPWRENVRQLRSRDWQAELVQVENPQIAYPDYYCCSFHAYENGNLNWEAAWEVESAAQAVHATIWQKTDGISPKGDPRLRQSYLDILQKTLTSQPQDILDLGCSVGMSTFSLQAAYPQARVTGLDLSPYYLAVANYRAKQRRLPIEWVHGAAETTGLPAESFDVVSAFLIFHELPQSAAKAILSEARRLLRPGGYFGLMDMNPRSEVYRRMPPYILTLLKSTEPYLDQYFTLDLESAFLEAGFQRPAIVPTSPRHRAVIAQVNG
jgi:ubiquinone/menaquinone biosynthesis C-methylase UbiE